MLQNLLYKCMTSNLKYRVYSLICSINIKLEPVVQAGTVMRISSDTLFAYGFIFDVWNWLSILFLWVVESTKLQRTRFHHSDIPV